jgi:hypothetical protein
MNELENFSLEHSGVTGKQYILGRRNKGSQQGVLRVGKYLAVDRSTGSDVYIDCLGPHAILICGKRGYGKSYTIGTLVEELSLQQPPVSDNIASIIIDSMGIFWTLAYTNTKEDITLGNWNLKPDVVDIQIFVPKGKIEEYAGMSINAKSLSILTSFLSGNDWCNMFDISPVHPLGILITRIVQKMKENFSEYSIDDILNSIKKDPYADDTTKQAAFNYIGTAKRWGIFEKSGLGIHDIVQAGRTAIIDVSTLVDTRVMSMVVGILGRQIYLERISARRQYEINRIMNSEKATMPMVWMFVDEAHLFLPNDEHAARNNVLVNEWLRQGRQPGLSLVLATQRPSALHPDVLSQSDIIICHRLTSRDDISALEMVRPTYMQKGIADAIHKMGEGKGVAFIIDDTTEASHIVQMRPRFTWHGGDEPSSLGS